MTSASVLTLAIAQPREKSSRSVRLPTTPSNPSRWRVPHCQRVARPSSTSRSSRSTPLLLKHQGPAPASRKLKAAWLLPASNRRVQVTNQLLSLLEQLPPLRVDGRLSVVRGLRSDTHATALQALRYRVALLLSEHAKPTVDSLNPVRQVRLLRIELNALWHLANVSPIDEEGHPLLARRLKPLLARQ
jgi:hypothetical protein